MFGPTWRKRLKELQNSKKFRKPSPVKDMAGLSSLLGLLNNPLVTGAVVPKGEIVNAISTETPATEAVKVAPIVVQPTPQNQAPSQAPVAAPAAQDLSRVCYTGRLMSGKDFVAAAAGQKVFSIAEPLYALQQLFFGTADKAIPGAREFLQAAGQIGRNEISATYPLSIERANFITLVREQAHWLPDDFSVDWEAYGRNADLWLDAMLCRVRKYLAANPGARVGVTNARFNNELTRLTSEGFVHFHILASAQTWSARLKQAGLTPESPAAKDVSEYLAASLDSSVTKQLSAQRTGNKLRAVWSDPNVPAPSSRLLSVAEFCAMFPK